MRRQQRLTLFLFSLTPCSYYSFEGGVDPVLLFAQLALQDFFQYLMHLAEHMSLHVPKSLIKMDLYAATHKPHHRFYNPKLFDAFNGSIADTVCMILIPLYLTACIVHCNVWTYMAFGSTYAAWLTLIHSEYHHPWDPFFRMIYFGTPADHHVHHSAFKHNFGHLFTFWDRLFGTYRSPSDMKTFNVQ